ncbi:TRAP transporter TAXI family solute receptor [Bradyrhizobium sp. AZCC 2262]|uniref:TAXI family TRAP transporter solute-binding subunit n=1 Tax=Bradyrhizobium sp. AZCC 2262 TaxID=3117022 RepID=UPI002FEF4BCB
MKLPVAVIVLAMSLSAAPQMGIVTGNVTGTYIKIGEDIKKIAEPSHISLQVFESAGSIQNVFDVRRKRGVQLGIVQSDVLDYIRDISDDNELKTIAAKLAAVYPLYKEEVHVLGDLSLKTLQDLHGKRVAIGPQRSGTYLTAKTIFFQTGVTPSKEVFLGGKEALDALRKGEIDAMFYVAGAPATLFSEGTTADDKFQLIGVDDKALDSYLTAVIPAGTYKWQESDVKTVAVKAVLITFSYAGEQCQNVAKVAKIIHENKAWLDANGHPKWREVNLDERLPKWPQYECVAATQEQPQPKPKGPNIKIVR